MKKLITIILILFPTFLTSQLDYKKIEQKYKSEYYINLQRNINQITDNQTKYDVKYYLLNLDINPSDTSIIGIVNIKAQVNEKINSTELDLTNKLYVDSVFVNNIISTFSQFNNILSINLDREYNINELLNLTIYYHGTPSSSGFGSFGIKKRNESGSLKTLIWTLSEPFGARDWWPCKDYPYDKADSVDIIITVPKDLIVASNGILRKATETRDKKTYYWHEGYPIATYLISITAYPYQIFYNYYKYSSTDSMPIIHYIFPDNYNLALNNINITPNMIKIFSELFGEYPFIREKYGHAQFMWSGGMEHQTCTSLGGWSEYLIVHELAHSWWGDMITCKDFHHIWLNEGFATYSEALYAEKAYGNINYKNVMNAAKYFGSGTIYVPTLDNVGRIFSGSLSYDKGSWVLHMLRHVVGDSTFFKILRTYYNDPEYKYNVATTEEFQGICESIYGKDLTWFFQEWIYQEYFPNYECSWSKSSNGNLTSLKIILKQIQNGYIFKMPIDITLWTPDGDTTIVVFDSLKSQEFNFTLTGKVDSIKLDKDEWILRKVTMTQLTNINEENSPNGFILYQNYPNPFNNNTIISFHLVRSGQISIILFNILGCEITTIADGNFSIGKHEINWDAKNIPSGLYFYKFQMNEFLEVKKLILIK